MGVYEITTDGGTYEIETADSPSLESEIGAVARRGLQGIASLGDLAENINPLQSKGPRAFGLNPLWVGQPTSGEMLESAATGLGLTTEEPQTPLGKVAGEIAYFAPGAIGGGTPGIVSSLGAGVAGGVAKAVDASPTAQTIASILGSLSPSGISVLKNIAAKTGQNLERSALNVQRSDLQKAAKFQSKGSTAENPLILGIEKAREKGIINALDDPASSIGKNNTEINRLNGEVSKILTATKNAQTDIVFPTFSNTKKFIESNPYQAEQLAKQYEQRVNTIADLWDGTISSLQAAKTKLYKIAYKGTTESKELDQAIAKDLKESIEFAAAKFLSPEKAAQLKALNAEEGLHLGLRDLLLKNKNLEKMPQGLAKALRRLVVSPIGGGAVGVMASMATGNPLPAILGAAGGALATKPGQLIGSTVAKKTAKMAAPFAGDASTAATNSVLSLLSPKSKNNDSKAPIPLDQTDSIFSVDGTNNILDMPMNKENVSAVEAEIDKDPYYSALYQAESGRNPNAKNPTSSASGGFQFINSTAKAIGLKDPFDLGQSYEAVQKLTDAHKKRFGNDPALLYSAHYLGSPLLDKVLKGKALTEKERLQVEYLKSKALPDFLKIYNSKIGTLEA